MGYCVTCQWFDEKKLECHRKAPELVITDTKPKKPSVALAMWPPIEDAQTSWCGEFKQRTIAR